MPKGRKAGLKAKATILARTGMTQSEYYSMIGKKGRANSKAEGYFAKLKREDPEKFKELSKKAAAKRWKDASNRQG